MGFVSNSRGIGSCVSGTPSFVGQSDSYVSDLRQREVPSSVRGSSISFTEKCNRGNSSDSVDTRVLFSSLLGSQENWGNETCDRSLYSEQLPFCSPFQNGDQQVYQSLYSSRYVDHQTGPFGCLFPYPNFFGFQEISPICLEQQSLPVYGGPVWPGGCTTGFYSGFSDGYSSPAYSVDSSSFLSGRFSSEGIRFRNSFSSYLPVYQTSSGPRLPYFLEKVSDTSFPRLPVFGGTLQDRFRSDFSPRGKISVTLSENSYFQQQSFSHGSTILSTTGLSEFSSRCGSSRSPSHSTSPVLSSGTLGLCFSSLGGSSTYSSCRTTSPRLVDSQGKCFDRCSFASPSSFSNSVYRFQSSGMGSLSRGKVCVGSVVSCSATRTHQFARDESCPISVTTFQDSSSFESSSASDGQYNSSGLLAESRRNSLSCSLSSLQRNSSSLSSITHSSGSQAYSRDLQCTGRLSVSLPQSSQHRMGTTASSVRLSCSAVGSSSCRSLCYQSESQTGNLCISSSRPSVLRSRRHVSLLGRNVRLCLSSIPLSSSSASQDQAIRLQDHSYCTSLAKTSMVSRTSASVLCQASETSFQTRSSVSVQGKSGTSKARVSSSSRLATLREGLRQKGFSEGATSHISKSVRQSTGIVYEAKWAIFCDWCSGRDIDPVRVTVQQLADFLVYLFEIKRLVPSTIKGYRSAIGRTISLLGGPDFGQNEYISLLVRSFSLERPKQNKLVPQWNLGLVLAALNSPPFEPAEEVDLRFLYYKCCFLLALASGRRRSEIHAFSVSDSCLRFNRNKSSVTLLTDPCFLGKNQIPDRGAEPVIIPALPEDASSRLSCPIRILSIYLDRTKNSRPANNTRLFLPLKKGISDISAKTISSWICRTILLAYESSGEKFLNRHAVKAHEVRALASSWALFNSASISEVLSAGFWRCQDSFTSFYLRSMSAQADSLFSLGPIVAAQHVSVPLVSERSGDSAVC